MRRFDCPYCSLTGTRSKVHEHLAQAHSDTLGTRIDEFTSHT